MGNFGSRCAEEPRGYLVSGIGNAVCRWQPVGMANAAKRQRRRRDAQAFQGCRPLPTMRGAFGDPNTRVIILVRHSKNCLLEYKVSPGFV